MSEWKEITSQKDIEELLYTCGGFHDTCIVSVNYRSGAFVDEKNAMHFGTCNDHELTVVLHGQWAPRMVELCFTGVRQFHLAGWRENYTCEIMEGYLSFYEGSWEGRQERLIVWSDSWGFDFSQRDAAKDEQTDTYIIAGKMKWRTAGNGVANISLEKIIRRKILYFEKALDEECHIMNTGYVRGFNQMLEDLDLEETVFIEKYTNIVKGLKEIFEFPKDKTDSDIEELSGFNNAIVDVLCLLDEKYQFDEYI